MDVTIRGAISIARRLQDPLAELVKIEPKSIGVGQVCAAFEYTVLIAKVDDIVGDALAQTAKCQGSGV